MGRVDYIRGNLWTVILLLCCSCICAQNANNDDVPSSIEEHLFLHTNTNLLFVGEYLYYSLYCIELESRRTSRISKIAYVEMIDEQGQIVFNHKLRLENGRSYGDFFVPTSVSSGNYKLIAYTRWAKNCGRDCFFESDLTIINPYQSNQLALLKKTVGNEQDSLKRRNTDKSKSGIDESPKTFDSKNLDVKISGKEFKTREKVSISVRNTADSNVTNYFSVSVRKVDSIGVHGRKTASLFLKEMRNHKKTKIQADNLPEIRGELMSGLVLDKSSSKPAKNVLVSLSIPGKKYQLHVANSIEGGRFYFNIDQPYVADEAVIQILSNETQPYELSVIENKKLDVSNIHFKSFELTKSMRNIIEERSFRNQIENAFFSAKPDSIGTIDVDLPLHRKNAILYRLDDYTRFPTIKETMVEIIKHAWISNDKNGKPVVQVRGNPPYFESPLPALVIVDGILIQDLQRLMEYDARKIEKIYLGRDRYIMGGKIFHGAIDIETFENDYTVISAGDSIKKISLKPPLLKKKYFQQTYANSTMRKLRRIPDFRYQLLWQPDLELHGEGKELTFFTSDVKGTFEIVLEGFTSSGKPISLKQLIAVE